MTRWFLSVALLAAASFAAPAQASCSFQLSPIALGSYDPLSHAPPPVLVSVGVSCTQSSDIIVSVGKGYSMDYTERTLRMGANTVRYNLFVGTNDLSVWGDGTANTSTISASVPAGEIIQLIGNARIYPGQSPLPGYYSDSLTFTISF